MNKIATGIVLVIILLTGIFLYHKYRVAPQIKFGNLELTDLNGKPVKLEDYKGKKLFLNFFATWCGPCIAEMPALDNAAETLTANNFLFIGISDESLPQLNTFSKRVNPSHIIILHAVKKLHDLGVFTVPTNYVLNSKGEVVYEKTGQENWAEPEILEQLKQKAN